MTQVTWVNRLLVEDARRLTEIIPAESQYVDVIITSPPYWNLKDYGAENQIGFGQTKHEYLNDIETVLRNCFSVTKSTGSLWLVVDTYRANGVLNLLPWEIGERANKVGWILRDLIIWDKQHSVPWHSKGQMRDVSEFILFFTKGKDYKYEIERIKTLDEISKWWVDFPERFNPKGKTPTNIWSIPFRTQGKWRKKSDILHHCSFPTALVARIIELTTDPGDLVMDPFAGAGIVLAQSAIMGRQFVGFEINQEYVRMFEEIVRNEVAAEWEAMKQWRDSQSNAKVDFETTIMRLRSLKYARRVTKPFIDALETEEKEIQKQVKAIVCIASIPEQYQRGQPFDVSVWVVVQECLSVFETAFMKVTERASRPPLTQYGIRSNLALVTIREFVEQEDNQNRVYYLYPAYKPRKYITEDTLQHWLIENRLEIEMANDIRIPMLANIAVNVEWALE